MNYELASSMYYITNAVMFIATGVYDLPVGSWIFQQPVLDYGGVHLALPFCAELYVRKSGHFL